MHGISKWLKSTAIVGTTFLLLWSKPAAALYTLPSMTAGEGGSAVTAQRSVLERPVYLADAKRRPTSKRSAKSSGRAKHLSGEATIKGRDQTKVDFEAADIGGQRKTPMGTLINQNKADKNYDFVKIRLRWHPEMVQSASSLDAGSGR